MSRAWRLLIAVAFLAGAGLVVARRAPRPAPVEELEAAPAPLVGLAIRVEAGAILPAHSEVALGTRLVLTRINAAPQSHVIGLSGYELALPPCTLQVGAARTDTLLLTLPGDDFAWLLDGQPSARLSVTGSHLVEGHR